LKEKVPARLEIREYGLGILRADHMAPSIRIMFVLTSPTSGGLKPRTLVPSLVGRRLAARLVDAHGDNEPLGFIEFGEFD
jgi:hypothetical protein